MSRSMVVADWIKRIADDERKRDALRVQEDEKAAHKADLVRRNGQRLVDEVRATVTRDVEAFRDDLAVYVDITRDKERYVHEGFVKFREIDTELNEIVTNVAKEQEHIFQRAQELQLSATRTIRLWNFFALLAGLAVAGATAWQVQRRFRQTLRSTQAVRREREFNNQMLEGMVSAIAAVDRQDRIRSANTVFMKIFPRATMCKSTYF